MYLARYCPGLQWGPANTATSTDRMRAHFMLGFTLYLIGTFRVDSEVQHHLRMRRSSDAPAEWHLDPTSRPTTLRVQFLPQMLLVLRV